MAMSVECGSVQLGTAAGSGGRSVRQARGLGFALTPEATVRVRGRAGVVREPRRGRTTVSARRGSVDVTPANPSLRGLRLARGRGVAVTRAAIGAPFPLVPDLLNDIPSPRQVRAGPAVATAPSKISLRSLRSSKCVRVALVTSARRACSSRSSADGAASGCSASGWSSSPPPDESGLHHGPPTGQDV